MPYAAARPRSRRSIVSLSLAELSRKRLTLVLRPLGAEQPEPWSGALDDFKRTVAALAKRVDVSVVLSNHFARYAVLPSQDGTATAEEEVALARFQFTKIHGERVKGWEV